ncbi:MAG: extracellular solute-binding protein [Spirochaetes bacterium]|nr:extracellular solute-binding protein [Spirochaetota bacterium]
MKKILIFVLVFFIFLFSCGTKKADLIIQSYMSDEKPKQVFAELVAEFEKQYKMKVEVNTTAHEQFKTQIVNYLTSKDAPDVLTWFAGFRMQQYAMKGLLEPVDDVFPGGKFEAEFPASFKVAASYNGKIYFVPQSWYWWAIYYNKEVFDKYGLKVPQTWEELLKVCEVLKRNGITPFTIGAKDTWTAGGWFDYLNVAVNGGEFHQKLTGGDVAYTDPKVVKTFEYLAHLAKNEYFIKGAASLSWQEAVAPMIEGKAAMYLMGQFIMDVIPEKDKGKFDFFRFPIIGNQTAYGVDTPTDGFIVPAKAKNKANAKKFLAFIASKFAQEYFATKLGRLAANILVPPPNPAAEKGLAIVKGAAIAMQFYDRDAPEEMAAIGMDAIVRILQNPADLIKILQEVETHRQRIYAEFKK